jgi:hypothetical protein
MRRFTPCIVLLVLALLGCSSQTPAPSGSMTEALRQQPAGAPAAAGDVPQQKMGAVAAQAQARKDAGEAPPQPQAKAPARKIIYTANAEVVTDDFEQAQRDLQQLLTEHGAYVARSEVRGAPGAPRTGNWTVRVPVEQFPAFLLAVSRLGEQRRSTTDSEDITDKYYDLAAHIKTDEAEEESLRKLLEKSSGRLDEVLTVRRELTAVRGRIEEQRGRLQRWDKETQLATVVLSLIDRKDYVPPVTPDFGGTVGRTLQGSLDALVYAGKVFVLVVVALLPWLAVLGVLGAPLLIWRRRRRRAARPETPLEVVPGE